VIELLAFCAKPTIAVGRSGVEPLPIPSSPARGAPVADCPHTDHENPKVRKPEKIEDRESSPFAYVSVGASTLLWSGLGHYQRLNRERVSFFKRNCGNIFSGFRTFGLS
jgi:hypothetical protein